MLTEEVDVNDMDIKTLSESEAQHDAISRQNIQRILEDRQAGNITLSEELAVKVSIFHTTRLIIHLEYC
jgi:hypothetical protein